MQVSKIIIFKGWWTRDDVVNSPDSLFVFGDNDVGKGHGGQAIIRGLPNTIGIPTKKYPSYQHSAYYTDAEYVININKIDAAIDKIRSLSKKYKHVVLPENGFGTGLADLENKAPKTFKYLTRAIRKLKTEL